MNLSITHCQHCPMYEQVRRCNHPEHGEGGACMSIDEFYNQPEDFKTVPPTWCPLRLSPMIVQLAIPPKPG